MMKLNDILKHSGLTAAVIALVATLTGCYDDKGGNDYDSALPDVVMTIPETAYSAGLGSTITITPDIKTDIPESDLEFIWEANGAVMNSQGRGQFTKLVPDDEQGRVLNYVCHLDSNITEINKSYTCRLHARQKSTGRDFYSQNTFTITIAGLTGLMMLYDDGSQSDIGILQATEFMPAKISIPETPIVTPGMYSINNGGAKLQGKGKSIVHFIPDWYWRMSDEYRIFVQTENDYGVLNYTDLSSTGDWSSMFYLSGDQQMNDGDPKGVIVAGSNLLGYDGDDMFMCTPGSTYPFLFPEVTPETECGDGNSFALAPALQKIGTNGIQYVGYATAINGDKTKKGFVGFGQIYPKSTTNYMQLLTTGADNVVFNPGDMNADLLYLSANANNHILAVMKGDATNANYAGRLFLVDLDANADPMGSSGRQNVPKYLYDLSTLTDISSAFAFTVGTTKNMFYYATPSGVYKYGVDGQTLYPAEKLMMADGSALSITGEVTMMKMLDSPNISTHNTEPILLVATYDGSNATLWALHMDETTGLVNSAVRYDASTVDGWQIGRIRDVNIKGA